MAVRSPSVLPGRVRGSIIVLAYLIALAPVASADPAEEPLPEVTAKALADRIRTARASYSSGLLEVEYEEELDTNSADVSMIVKLPGKFRYTADGLRWRVEYDSMTAAPFQPRTPVQWVSGFDGSDRFTWEPNRNLATLGETHAGASHCSPHELFWNRSDVLLWSLASGSTSIGQRTVEGVPCYVVTADHGHGYTSETCISPRQGYLPVRQAGFLGGRMYSTYNLRDVREVSPGLWAPGQIFALNRQPKLPDDGEQKLRDRRISRVVRFEPGRVPEPGSFRFEVPPGVDVTDLRLGYTYHNDPWWPEISKFLRDQFDWPQPDMSPLGSLGSYSNLELDGKPAPPLRAEAWLDGRPRDWERLRGKVTLIEFWSAESSPCGRATAALRRIYDTYHGSGLEIIAVREPSKDLDELRRSVRDFRVPFPVAVDEEGDGSLGATARAYGVSGFPCVFVVDHAGIAHAVDRAGNPAKFVEMLTGYLRRAGARDVLSIETRNPIPAEMLRATLDEFRRRAFEASDKGCLVGTVKDEQGRAIEGARIEATLQFVLKYAPGSGFHFTMQGRRSTATTGRDGRFELTGLRKGRYALTYSAARRASLEHTTWIHPDLRPVTADAVLDQGDAIEGIVRDELGTPVAGVEVVPTERRYVQTGKRLSASAPVVAAMTDEAGRFRLEKLMIGDYRLELVARGFARQTLGWVPAGSAGVTAVLKRAAP